MFVAAAVAIGVTSCLCCSICLPGVVSQVEIVYIRNPAPRIVAYSAGSDEPEDPVDFSSKPKSSATSLGS